MAAVAPLRETDDRSHKIEKIRPSDLRRKPLQRRPLNKRTTPIVRPAVGATDGSERPHLEVVPHRRRAVSIVVLSCVVLFSLCLGAVAFQTHLAQNQLALDRTERAVKQARERYDILRRQRAELRSPNRLAVEASRLGMVPADNGEFMTVPPEVVAAVAAAASGLPNTVSDTSESSFDQFAGVKSVTGDVP
jgi:hypothetical protein